LPTLLDVLRLSTSYLAQRGSESARLDAELLTAHSLGLRRLDLYLQFDRPLREDELEPVRALLRRRAAGEPVAYLVGEREFYGRSFVVTPAVLIPRPDTETLVEAALAWARSCAADGAGLRIADVGTGSGCIGITMAAELPGAEVFASDVSREALAVAAENAARIGVADRVTLVEGVWLQPLAGRGPFDMVLSNPPYVTTAEMADLARDVRDFEPAAALTAGDVDGLDSYRSLLDGLATLLRPDGYLAVEVDPRRADTIAELFAASFPRATVRGLADLTNRSRVVEVMLAC
jgi:release factor glutamine methyltransferase